MCNFGHRPTFEENELVLEVHIFGDISNSLYGYIIWIEFLERIRNEKKFSSADKLIKQLEKDEKECLSLKYKYELGE
jgi:riboflavin kinase/FMN adenylyltransferase